MYSHCIFCSAELGANESIEHFPVGRSVAFDAWKGRLWAVCPSCRRWNLAPLEERWEPVEEAEKAFATAQLKAQSENIGLAKLADGARLIRVGEAKPTELAAWRYGDQLLHRRRRHLIGAGVAVGAGAAAFGGLTLLAAGSAFAAFSVAVNGPQVVTGILRERKVLYRLPAEESPTGRAEPLRLRNLERAHLAVGEDNTLAVHLPGTTIRSEGLTWMEKLVAPLGGRIPATTVRGASARHLLARLSVTQNAAGARQKRVDRAIDTLVRAGDAETYLHRLAADGVDLGVKMGPRAAIDPYSFWEGRQYAEHGKRMRLAPHESLALEMALHEEEERRALEGELAALQAAWREAEEIAVIADSL